LKTTQPDDGALGKKQQLSFWNFFCPVASKPISSATWWRAVWDWEFGFFPRVVSAAM